MNYKIEIEYHTGNSFNSYDTKQTLEPIWTNSDICKKNLKNIKEHFDFGKEIETSEDILNLYHLHLDKPWFVKGKKDNVIIKNRNKIAHIDTVKLIDKRQYSVIHNISDSQSCINLILDNGDLLQMYCFWIGYFERLIGAKIIPDTSDMEFYV